MWHSVRVLSGNTGATVGARRTACGEVRELICRPAAQDIGSWRGEMPLARLSYVGVVIVVSDDCSHIRSPPEAELIHPVYVRDSACTMARRRSLASSGRGF